VQDDLQKLMTMNAFLRSATAGLRHAVSAVFLLALLSPAPGRAAGTDDACLDCHSDASLTRTLDNGTVQSLTVTRDSLGLSRHADLSCVDCHRDMKDLKDFPHPERLKAVECAFCHSEVAHAVAAGGHESKVKCAACHGSHRIIDPASLQSPLSKDRINRTCADCHNAMHAPHRGRTTQYATYDVGLHGSHPAAAGGAGPACTTCHGTHTIVTETKLSMDLEGACIKCHPQVAEEFKQSVHATINEGRANSHCFECHGEHRSRAPSDTTLRVTNESPAEATCGSCHKESVARYNQSLHAFALESGSPRAPRCESCHGAHNIRRVNDPQSPMHRSRMVETCGKCHSRIGISLDPDVLLPRSFENYQESTHGKLLAKGNDKVPVCVDCHGGHAIKGSSDPTSTIALLNIDKTCGRCHIKENELYTQSIHYRALKSGITDSPTCTGCHGEHIMLSPKDPKSKVSHANVAHETCGKCHENPIIIRKYGLAPDVVQTYNDSYHGLATKAKNLRTPNCADCHNAHDVRTARDSLATIYPANIPTTCGKCHPNADVKFAASYTHQTLQPRTGGLNYWIARIYWMLIIVIIGGMVIHNLVILNFHLLEAKRRQSAGRKVVRFDTHQLIQHFAVTVTFILLAVSGFALKYPDAWWVKIFAAIGLNEEARRITHRTMAVGLVVCSVYHVWYLFATRRGWDEWKSMLPGFGDLRDMTQSLKYHLGLQKRTPEFGRYDYSQKAEYWALVWGTLVMIVTGVILWFPAELSPLLPSWAVSVSQTIHLYEAWLATLAIVVWHFFFVIFHPEEYPMSWTWLTGKMSLDHVKHRHGRWYKTLQDEERIAPEPEPAPESNPTTPVDH
jgi:formate dehydrogenase gamma subunit